MHRELFHELDVDENIRSYFSSIENRCTKISKYGRALSPEEHYFYIAVHEFKHHNYSGTGIRSLLDTFMYFRHFYGTLDLDYISDELAKIGVKEYESEQRELAEKIFGSVTGINEISDAQCMLLDKFIYAGTYGNIGNKVKNRMVGWDYRTYIKKRVFLDEQSLKVGLSFFLQT